MQWNDFVFLLVEVFECWRFSGNCVQLANFCFYYWIPVPRGKLWGDSSNYHFVVDGWSVGDYETADVNGKGVL